MSLLRRRCADQLRRAHSARRVRDGANAAATELMLRAALLRRSCDGVADGAAQTSSVALILRIASQISDALNEEPSASSPPQLIQISMAVLVAQSPRPPPWPRNLAAQKYKYIYYIYCDTFAFSYIFIYYNF